MSAAHSLFALPLAIGEHIDQFSGRAWLLPTLLDWFEKEEEERLFLLTGGPGTGKSMIMAWLAGYGPLPDDQDAQSQLVALRQHVVAAHFCQANTRNITGQAFAESIANQLTATVPGFGDALAKSLEDRVVIQAVQHAETVIDSTMTGVKIVTLNLAGLEDSVSFDRTFFQPLQNLYDAGYDQPLIILVDGLDEAWPEARGQQLVRLLSQLTNLPAMVRILATSRPDPRLLKLFGNVRQFDLIDDAPADDNDIYDFAKEWLTTRSGLSPEAAARVAQRVADEAARIFLYAYMVLRDVIPTLALPALVEQDEEFALPKGLGGLYHAFLNRELGVDEDRWFRELRPLLGLIAVAQGEGVTRQQLQDLLAHDPLQDLRICQQYLTGELNDGPFRLIHKSLADFLLNDPDNTDYTINAVEMHDKLAGDYSGGVVDWEAVDSYHLRYLPTHLAGAGRDADLRRLLLDFDYLQARLAATDINGLIGDYDLLETTDRHDAARLVQGALQLSAHPLATDPRQLAGQLIGRLQSLKPVDLGSLLTQAAAWRGAPWLRPVAATLTPPGGPLLLTLAGHNGRATAVAVTPDGRRAVSGSDDCTLKVWDLATGGEAVTLTGHTSTVYAVAVTADGRRAVSGSDDCTLKVWDLATRGELATLTGHTGKASAVAMTADGRRAVSGSSDGTLKVWDLATCNELATLSGHPSPVRAVAMTADGRRAVSGSWDGTLKVWDLDTGGELATLTGHFGDVYAVAVTPDGQRAVSGSWDGTLKVWDLATRGEAVTLTGHTSTVYAVAVTPDGRRAVSGSWDGTLKVWDLATGGELATLTGHTDYVYAVAVTADGRRAVSGSSDGTLKVWDLATCNELATLSGHPSPVRAVAMTADGRRAISGSIDSSLKVWDLVTGGELATLAGHTSWVAAVAMTADGRRAVSGSGDHTVKVWDLATGNELATLTGHTGEVSAVTVTPDGRRAVSASYDHTLKVWDLAKGGEPITLTSHTNVVTAVAVTADGRRAVSGSADHTLKVWGLASGDELATFTGHYDSVSTVAVTSDGRRAVSGSWDGTLKVWDLDTGGEPATLTGHTRTVKAVAVTPDGRRAVSGSADHTLKVWDLATGGELTTLVGHIGEVTAVAVTPDGRRAVSACEDGTLKVWDLVVQRLLTTFTGDSPIEALACTSLSRTCIIVGERSGRVHILQLEEDE